jgi:transcriptional regulator with XRE-family HTH domain
MKKTQNSLNLLRNYIQKKLKIKKLTYKQLASELGVTEVTIKRWMTKRDFSVTQLIQIGEILGFGLFEVLHDDFKQTQTYQTYTDAQEKFMIEHPMAAFILMKLIAHEAPARVQKTYGLSSSAYFKIIRQLEAAGFLEILPGDKLRLMMKGPFLSQLDGAFSGHYIPRMRQFIWTHLESKFQKEIELKDEATAEDFEIDRPFEMYMTREMAADFSKDLMQVLAKYRYLTVLAHKPGQDSRPVSGYIGVTDYDLWRDVYLKS